ncbi:hypothetical protein L208DRAFT_1331481 [Tricholoma matsutake]|nr:hypothetical protein L208DRAFT_1331481 [Tricholoma matsutake 945]
MAPGASLADQHTCSKCGQALFTKKAKGGMAPGHYYIHCLPCHFHFTFPLDTPHGPSIPSTMTLPSMGPSASATHTAVNHCVKANCVRVAHRSCINKMCKVDCIIIKGGCAAPAHTFDKLSQLQQSK